MVDFSDFFRPLNFFSMSFLGDVKFSFESCLENSRCDHGVYSGSWKFGRDQRTNSMTFWKTRGVDQCWARMAGVLAHRALRRSLILARSSTIHSSSRHGRTFLFPFGHGSTVQRARGLGCLGVVGSSWRMWREFVAKRARVSNVTTSPTIWSSLQSVFFFSLRWSLVA